MACPTWVVLCLRSVHRTSFAYWSSPISWISRESVFFNIENFFNENFFNFLLHTTWFTEQAASEKVRATCNIKVHILNVVEDSAGPYSIRLSLTGFCNHPSYTLTQMLFDSCWRCDRTTTWKATSTWGSSATWAWGSAFTQQLMTKPCQQYLNFFLCPHFPYFLFGFCLDLFPTWSRTIAEYLMNIMVLE